MLIHRYWTGVALPPHNEWMHSCLQTLNPGHEVVDWTDDKLASKYDVFFKDEQVAKKDELRHRSNIVRLLLLFDFGGAWYDHDVIPFLPVNTLPCPSVGSHRGLCNSFMYFDEKDDRIYNALCGILEQPSSDRPSTVVSGSVFLRTYLTDVHYLEYPFDPYGALLHSQRPFAVHIGGDQ